MPLHSFETRSSTTAPAVEDGPVLECSLPGHTSDQPLRIRARRQYAASREALFAAWTTRMAWDNWMRLRARSRSTIAAYGGGAFRLELAEGPTIHVVTGTFLELREPDHLRLSWQHHHGLGRASTIDVTLRTRLDRTELSLVHSEISSRREAAWLMRLWTMVLRRLDAYLAGPDTSGESLSDLTAAADARLRRRTGGAFARSAGIVLAAATAVVQSASAQPTPQAPMTPPPVVAIATDIPVHHASCRP